MLLGGVILQPRATVLGVSSKMLQHGGLLGHWTVFDFGVYISRLGPDPSQTLNYNRGSRNVNFVCDVPEFCISVGVGFAPLLPLPATQNHLFVSGAGKGVCCLTQQARLLCHTAGIVAASHGSHVRCVSRQTCLLWDTEICLLYRRADTSFLSRER